MSDRVWSDMGDGARDVAGHAYADIGNHYLQFLTGRPAPMTSMPGVMETTTETDSQVAPPESYQSALIKHGVAEGAEREADHWRQYATRDTSAPDIEPGVTGWERYSEGFHAAPDATQGHYGVGPASASASTTEQEAGAHEPEL